MADCRDLEPHFTAYVDGECPAAACAEVETHLQTCPRCHARVSTERAAHDLLRARAIELRRPAPDALRQRCAAQARKAAVPARVAARPATRRSWLPLSLAASLILAASVFVLFGWGSAVETYAAQIAADHIKCFQFPPALSTTDVDALGRRWEAANGWSLKLAPPSPADALELVGIRRCGSTRGRVAHVLYRWRGEPLSVYVLNDRLEEAGARQAGTTHAVERFGEQEIIWSEHGRTYAVVARAPVEDLQQVARYVRRRFE